jgi:hypothetical protein
VDADRLLYLLLHGPQARAGLLWHERCAECAILDPFEDGPAGEQIGYCPLQGHYVEAESACTQYEDRRPAERHIPALISPRDEP